VECSICEERYHHKCILLSKKQAREIGDDWGCGFCLEAEDNVVAGNSSLGEGVEHEGNNRSQRWTLRAKKKNKRGKSHVGAKPSLIYERLLHETPAYYRRKRIARPIQFLGPNSWGDFIQLVDANASDCRRKIEALKNRANSVLRNAGHHVGDAQGADGLERAQLNDALLDVLADAGFMEDEYFAEDEDE
jgi:hypothetical protein